MQLYTTMELTTTENLIIISCTTVAKVLQIKHKCSRKWFLNKKNRSRHKLRSYCISIERDRDYLREAFSILPTIRRSSRHSTIDERIVSAVGGEKVEMCIYLRHRISKILSSNTSGEGQQPTSSTGSLLSGTVNVSIADDTCSTMNTSALSTNAPPSTQARVGGAANNSNSGEESSIATIQEEQEHEREVDNDTGFSASGDGTETTSHSHPRKRRAPNTVLIDIANNIKLGSHDHWRKPSELQDRGSLRIRADEGLAYLIRLCGFKNLTNVVHEKEIMSEVFYLIEEIKARAITAFRLTPSEIDLPAEVDHFATIQEATNPIISTHDVANYTPGGENDTAQRAEYEAFFNANLSNKKYIEATKKISDASNGGIEMRSNYHIFKPARELITTYKIPNSEFLPSTQQLSTTSNSSNDNNVASVSLSANLERSSNNKIVLKNDSKIPEFLFGAFLPLDKAVNLIFNCLGKVVAQVPGATLHNALGKSILLGCADAAEMDSLADVNKHVTSFSLVPTSLFLIERCGYYTTSIKNIFPHNQLNSKELLAHMKHVLHERFHCWLSVKESHADYDIEFVDMHDAKFTYTMLQCSMWSRLYKPFCSCDCGRGQGATLGFICTMFTKEKYEELYKKSEEKMRAQEMIAAVRRSGRYTAADHRDWVDRHNSGVSHMGIPPATWSILSLTFDVFHGRVNYVKLQVDYCRKLFEGDYESLDQFSVFLMSNLKSWKSFQITPWLNNDKSSRLRGEHTKDFTKSTHQICEKISSLRDSSDSCSFCEALYAYERVHCFLSFVIIDDFETANAFLGGPVFTQNDNRKNIGEKMILEFEYLADKLYRKGLETFLTDRVPGDHETFYAHAMRWYYPSILKKTYSKYGLGLGIYSMEGFEAINFMTKRTIRDHSNRRGNICAQTMVRMVMNYMNHNHDVVQELKERQKQKKKQIETIKRIHHGQGNNDENNMIENLRREKPYLFLV